MCGGQRDVVGRHDRAGGAGLVAGQPADILALGLGQERQHRVDHVLVEPVDQVGPLVVRHQVEKLGRLLGRHRLDEPDLAVVVEVAEDLGAVAGRQDPEQGIAVVGLEVLDQLGDPAGVVVGEEVAQSRRLRRRGSARGGRVPGADVAWTLVRRDRTAQREPITSLPTYGRKTSGTSIRPSDRW